MNNLDKKITVIFEENSNVPSSFETAIKEALLKERMINVKKKIMPLKTLVTLIISVVIIVRWDRNLFIC